MKRLIALLVTVGLLVITGNVVAIANEEPNLMEFRGELVVIKCYQASADTILANGWPVSQGMFYLVGSLSPTNSSFPCNLPILLDAYNIPQDGVWIGEQRYNCAAEAVSASDPFVSGGCVPVS